MTEAGPLLVHGFAHADIVADLSGVLGARADKLVKARARNGIVAFASRLDRETADDAFETSEAVTALALDHAKVLAAIASRHDVVPLRLGTLVSGRQALLDLCETQAVAMRGVLDAIKGRVEFGVRIIQHADVRETPNDQGERPVDGRSYLRGKALARGMKVRTSANQDEFCSSLLDELHALSTVTSLSSDAVRLSKGRLVDLACLVERERVGDFETHLSSRVLDAKRVFLSLELTGPWPAFSFVTKPSAGVN